MNTTIYANMREITPEQERDILVQNALSAIGTARQRNDHLFNKDGWIPQRSKKESIMAASVKYVRNEWKHWVLAIVGLLLWAMANAAVAAPVVKHRVDGVKIIQDAKSKKWFTVHNNRISNLDSRFTDVRIVWKGKLRDEPLLLVAGNRPGCKSDYALLWFRKDGQPEMVNQFPACEAGYVEVEPGYPVTKVEIDGQAAFIDWEHEGEGNSERVEEMIKIMTAPASAEKPVEEKVDVAEETNKQ